MSCHIIHISLNGFMSTNATMLPVIKLSLGKCWHAPGLTINPVMQLALVIYMSIFTLLDKAWHETCASCSAVMLV